MNSDKLQRLRDNVLLVCYGLADPDPQIREINITEYENLVNEFAVHFESQTAPQQIEAARRDPEYFIRLIDLARAYSKKNKTDYKKIEILVIH